MSKRSKGFTLIELLVVIAIIGILAAMVFPVFARARESARKAVCLSNVKNIGLAVQMYLADNNDTLPPDEKGTAALEYFNTAGPQSDGELPCDTSVGGNPYLRWPVILDEYVKNRDVWRCPSAKMSGGAGQILPGVDYLQTWIDNTDFWTADENIVQYGPCYYAWPPGWGGDVTDTFTQRRYATATGGSNTGLDTANKAFVMSIGINGQTGLKLAAVQDTVNYVICGDGGANSVNQQMAENYAWPDICCISCSRGHWCMPLSPNGETMADWEACAATAGSCGLYSWAPNGGAFLDDRGLLKPYTRHLGASNLGFLDGHAATFNAEKIVSMQLAGDLGGLHFGCSDEFE